MPALTFRLAFRKEPHAMRAGKMRRVVERDAELPDTPPQHNDVTGPYGVVAAEAVKLNDAQLRSGFLDYLFWPEIVTPTTA